MAMTPQDMYGSPGGQELPTEEERVPGEGRVMAPRFPPPEPLDFSEEEAQEIADRVFEVYRAGVEARDEFNSDHLTYDQMFRGQVMEFAPRDGPWDGSANLHIQAPYWLCDAINVRLTSSIWSQVPQVKGQWTEPTDKLVSSRAARRVEWNLQPSRMNARSMWSRISSIRCIHGVGVGAVTYAHTEYRYREYSDEVPEPEIQRGPDGQPLFDRDGQVVTAVPEPPIRLTTRTRYRGPVLYPLEWDDVVVPVGAMNLQPNDLDNPGGAIDVSVRCWEPLSLMIKKFRQGIYPYMMDGERDRTWWEGAYPAQDRSGGYPNNTERERQQDKSEGMNRTYDVTYRRGKEAHDPQFEVVVHYAPREFYDEDNDEYLDEECVFFVCLNPRVFLGGYRLSDIVWTGQRPLVDLHFKHVSNRFYSMGVCEIVRYLSNELDTLHNMRQDIGFATNLPWFFYRASSGMNYDEIILRPMKGVPVDNPRDIVFPQFQNVTTFYHQEETLLLSIIERVLGITDLFLGVSPTRGAAARHATGFMGSQQEAMARMSEVMAQDADSFSQLCNLVYALDIQYGPVEREFKLSGTDEKLTRDELWFQGTYDFTVGANTGSYSQYAEVQRSQGIMQLAGASPLTNQEMGRRWEAEAMYYRALHLTEAEIEAVIGPKSAVSRGESKPQNVENNEMAQYFYGDGAPAPVHPNDDDMRHIQETQSFVNSATYEALGRPNEQGFVNHMMMHQRQMMAKRQQEQMMAAQNMQGGPGQQQQGVQGPQGMPGAQGANAVTRANAQVGSQAQGQGTTPQDTYGGGNGQSAGPPPFLMGGGG